MLVAARGDQGVRHLVAAPPLARDVSGAPALYRAPVTRRKKPVRGALRIDARPTARLLYPIASAVTRPSKARGRRRGECDHSIPLTSRNASSGRGLIPAGSTRQSRKLLLCRAESRRVYGHLAPRSRTFVHQPANLVM